MPKGLDLSQFFEVILLQKFEILTASTLTLELFNTVLF